MYNGYENYTTWSICLWLANDEYLYSRIKRFRQRYGDDTYYVDANIAEMITKTVLPEGTPDLNNVDIEWNRVNWEEVAETINEL